MIRTSMRHVVATVALALCVLYGLCGCGLSNSSSTTPSRDEVESTQHPDYHDVSSNDLRPHYEPDFTSPEPPEPAYEDPRWPTTNPQLLAIPEAERYYNAWNHVWTTCTVAGPVVNVYQAKDSAGMPIFISIGASYPSSDCVTLVVWADAYNDFAEMINDVDSGGAWLSVTGYLSEYNGGLQFDISDGYIEYRWWA